MYIFKQKFTYYTSCYVLRYLYCIVEFYIRHHPKGGSRSNAFMLLLRELSLQLKKSNGITTLIMLWFIK